MGASLVGDDVWEYQSSEYQEAPSYPKLTFPRDSCTRHNLLHPKIFSKFTNRKTLMKTRTSRTAIWMATLLFGSNPLAFSDGHQKMTIGEVTALIAEASTADEPSEL